MFTKYENGAEVEIGEVYRYESGAEVEAEAVYKYANGAEEEVWSSGSPYTFHQYGQNNATINGDGSVTMGVSWSAQSGGDANFVVEGVFEVGKEYTLTFGAEIDRYENGSTSSDRASSTVKIGGTSQSYTIVAGSNTVTITPKATDAYLQITISDGGQYSGSITVALTDIRINNRLVKKS